ncbi:MAG: thermonuclease family protein [Bergeyella cardium]
MFKRVFIVLLMLFAVLGSSQASKTSVVATGKVVGVKDGDTFKVLIKGKEVSVRLLHIDCPEKKQAFGKRAKQKVSDLCFGKEVKLVARSKTDRYKRLLAEVYVDDLCVNKELVRLGLAWHFKRYSNDKSYAHLENEARKNKVGLWVEPSPVAPWDFRKSQKKK